MQILFFLAFLLVAGLLVYFLVGQDLEPLKPGTKITFKVIKDNPEDGQSSISHLIGQKFDGVVCGNYVSSAHGMFYFDEIQIIS